MHQVVPQRQRVEAADQTDQGQSPAVLSGQQVGRGAPLVTLSGQQQQASLASAEAALKEAEQLYLRMARLTNPDARLAGVSLNTSALDETASQEALAQAERELGVPAFDPMRTPLDRAIAALLG